jgi:DNA-binding MarR family transcriptional regulator
MIREGGTRMEGRRLIGFEIRSLNNLIMRNIESAFEGKQYDGVTATNGWIIGFLAANSDKNIYQKDLEEQFSITRSTASKVLILMEKKGLIERHRVPHDARLKKLTLTKKAQTISSQMTENAKEFETILTKGLTPEELDSFYHCIQKMRDNLN